MTDFKKILKLLNIAQNKEFINDCSRMKKSCKTTNCSRIKKSCEKTNFWQNVLKRLVIVTLMLAKGNLSFRKYSNELFKNNKGNFLSIIQHLAKYDTVLDKLLQLPKGFPKYLSPLIQNELISVLAENVLRDIKSELQSSPFFLIRYS